MSEYTPISKVADSFDIKAGDFINLSSDVMALAFITKKNEGEFDPNKVLDSFIEKLTPEGTLIVPTFNFDFSNKGFFDYKNTKCTTGALGNAALERGDFKRTWHPMHSYAVWGKYQDEICSMNNLNSFGEDSPFAFMIEKNAIQLLLGCDYQRGMTFVHHVEFKANVPYRFFKEFTGTYVDENGNSLTKRVEYPARYYEYGSVEKFNRIGEILEEHGVSEKKYFNGILSYQVDLAKSYPYIYDDIINNRCANLYDFSISRDEIWKN